MTLFFYYPNRYWSEIHKILNKQDIKIIILSEENFSHDSNLDVTNFGDINGIRVKEICLNEDCIDNFLLGMEIETVEEKLKDKKGSILAEISENEDVILLLDLEYAFELAWQICHSFIEMKEQKSFRLHIFCVINEACEHDTYQAFIKGLGMANEYTSVCLFNFHEIIGFNEVNINWQEKLEMWDIFKELLEEECQDILPQIAQLPDLPDNMVYLYNHSKQKYQIYELSEEDVVNPDVDSIYVNESIAPNKGRETCQELRKLRRKFAKKYRIKLNEEDCTYQGRCRGTCQVCDKRARSLWTSVYQEIKESENKREDSDARIDIRGVSRLRNQIDGGGIRSLVVMNTCLLNCKYCINRKYINRFPNIRKVTPYQLGTWLEQDGVYFEMTNGGVTFGGGEPLLYPEFIHQFHEEYPKWNIDVETSLNVDPRNIQMLIPDIDIWHIDIKDIHSQIYIKYTGQSNILVLENLQLLIKQVSVEKIHIRVPHISGFNTTEDVMNSISYLKKLGMVWIEEFVYQTEVE